MLSLFDSLFSASRCLFWALWVLCGLGGGGGLPSKKFLKTCVVSRRHCDTAPTPTFASEMIPSLRTSWIHRCLSSMCFDSLEMPRSEAIDFLAEELVLTMILRFSKTIFESNSWMKCLSASDSTDALSHGMQLCFCWWMWRTCLNWIRRQYIDSTESQQWSACWYFWLW